jgi:hypothetical protein
MRNIVQSIGNRPATMAAVPLALIGAAGISILIFGPDRSPWISSALFALVIAAYACATGPGKRSRIRDFAYGGLILLAIIVILLNRAAFNWEFSLTVFEFLFLVGYAPGGAPDAPLFVLATAWWLSIMLLLGVGLTIGVLARAVLTRANAGRSRS